MREEIQNRHVRFSGEGQGLWSEPIEPMKGRDNRFVANPEGGADVYPEQIAGQRVPNKAQVTARSQGWLADWAVWQDFKLVQPDGRRFHHREAHQTRTAAGCRRPPVSAPRAWYSRATSVAGWQSA